METTEYYETVVRRNHAEIKDEWVERVLDNPYHIEFQPNGRIGYYGYIDGADKWLRVILEIAYFEETDTLSLWNGTPASEAGDLIANGALDVNDNTEGIATGDIIADYDSDGKVVGFTIEHASELLLHPLARKGEQSDHLEVKGIYAGYAYTLSLGQGTLILNSDREQVRSREVADNLTAHYDSEGDAAGFTLERAAELLLPHLKGEAGSQRIPVSVESATNND